MDCDRSKVGRRHDRDDGVSMEERLAHRHLSSDASGPQTSYASEPATIIEPTKGWVPVRPKDIIRSRELLYFLVWSDLKVRYKQTVLGVAWAVLQPLAVMVVFAVVFGLVVRVPTGEIPYPVFAYSGLVVWTYFASALNRASHSMLEQRSVITKVYFPRMIVPIAPVVAGLVDLAAAFVVLVAMVGFYGFTPTTAVWTLPLFTLLAVMTALSVSLWLSALMAQYRDVRLLLPVIIQLWFFATPIIYPTDLIPESWRPFYEALNPIVGVVEGFRWALLDVADAPNPQTMAVSIVFVAIVFVGGLYYFRRVERIFADVV
jgi:lipopolysaccharide transport system permease protein